MARRFRRHKTLATAIVCAVLFVAATGLLLHNHLEEVEEARRTSYEQLVLRGVVKLELAEESRSNRPRTGSSSHDKKSWVELAAGAVDQLEEAVELFPDQMEAGFHLARALRLLDRDVRAKKVLDRLDPEFLPVAVLKRELEADQKEQNRTAVDLVGGENEATWEASWYSAYRSVQEEKWREAALAYGKLIEGYRGDPGGFLGMALEARLGRGRAYLQAEDFENALIDFAVAAELWPDLTAPLFMMGKTYLLMERPREAEKAFERLHERAQLPDEVALWITDLYHVHEGREQGLKWAEKIENRATREKERAHFLFHLDRKEEALQAARVSLAIKPDAGLHVVIGRILGGRGAPEEAVAEFDEALTLFPTFPDGSTHHEATSAHINRAQAYHAMGEHDKAIEDFSEAIRLDRNAWGAYNCRAVTYAAIGDHERAILDYDEAIRIQPEHDAPWHNRGNLHAELGRFEEAAKDFAEAIRLRPRPDVLVWWSYVGVLRLAMGDIDGYRTACRELLDRSEGLEEPRTANGIALTFVLAPYAIPDLSRAVALAEKAVEGDPNFHHQGILGAALYRAGRFEEAASRFTQLAWDVDAGGKSKVFSAYNGFFLAMTHHRLGNRDEAKEWLEKTVTWTDDVLRPKEEGDGASVSWRKRARLKLLRDEARVLIEPADAGE